MNYWIINIDDIVPLFNQAYFLSLEVLMLMQWDSILLEPLWGSKTHKETAFGRYFGIISEEDLFQNEGSRSN